MQQEWEEVRQWLETLQDRICQALSAVDGSSFREDQWHRPEGGGGRSRVLEEGQVIEKGGVNLSVVSGAALPPSATASRPELKGCPWQAMGVSLVIHPRNPYAPTSHMNVRCLRVDLPDQEPVWWLGGGFDLTPYYGFREDCRHWHQVAQDALAPFSGQLYETWKAQCDQYFFLKHRQEPRGIGGLFFDDYHEPDWNSCQAVWRAVGNAYLDAYLPILLRRKDIPYGARERDFQLYRRGRYVEFNLVYDRGTLFGLQSGGRTESILMSLPNAVHWRYDWHPEAGSPEAELTDYYLKARNWLDEDA